MKFAVATLALALAPLYAQAIDRPTDLQGTQIAEHTVAFSWAPVEGASRYEVTVNGIGRGSRGAGRGLSLAQNGRVQTYASFLFAGVAALAGIFVVLV